MLTSLAASGVQACPVGDLSGDCTVDWQDLQIFAGQWLDTGGCSEPNCADLDDSNNVDAFDFALLAENWGKTGNTLVINEFMAKNDSFIQDPCGNYDDWVELYNYGNTAVDIGGMYLTDNLLSPTKWQVPDNNPSETTIAAGGYLLIWADEETHQGTLHADFKLKASGDEIGLYDANANSIDSITFGSQDGDNSYGRFPNGSDIWQVFIHDTNTPPTPGASNGGEPIGQQVLISEIMYHPYHNSIALEPEDIGEEYIELFNGSAIDVNLQGWRFTDGVEFTFPNVIIGSGAYLVVAADVNTFTAKYPGVTNMVGGWVGRLSNSGEAIELINAEGVRIDWVRYADEGDWSVRELSPLDAYGHNGWVWSDTHDGDGNSLELMNPALSNEYGQNWSASLGNEGTPGVGNSVAASDIAPLILDVTHLPAIPQSTDAVTVTAHIVDELTTGITVTLHYRVDGSIDFNTPAMLDDGAHGDGRGGDGIYGTQIPAHPNDTIVEFYIEASDAGAKSRTWPAPTQPSGQQLTNSLYQVNDRFDPDAAWTPGSQPIYYIIMTDDERYELLVEIGNGGPDKYSNAQMNSTFISADGVDIKTRYNVGVRNRGKGSRLSPPMNYRVNLPHDRPWKGVTAININSRVAHSQLIGSVINRLAGLPAADATAVQTRVNGLNRTDAGAPYFDSYAHMELIDSDFADKHFPDDDGGNAYRVVDPDKLADLSYLGTNPASYIARGYDKATNRAENDYSDLINLTNVLTNTPDANYVEEVKKVVNVEQWLRWFAVQALFSNTETNLGNGYGDDYYLYCGIEDTRFVLVPYDMDNILGLYDIPDPWSDPGVYNASIWLGEATNTNSNIDNLPIIERFLRHPAFVGRYLAYLKEEIKTTFSPEQINPMLEHALSGFVPPSTINSVKSFVAARNAYVLSQIPQHFTINSDLSVSKGYHKATGATLTELKAVLTDNTVEPRSVRVNGQLADWLRVGGKWWDTSDEWTIDTNITLNPGINRIIVQTFDDANGTGNEVERGSIDIWYDSSGSTVPNPLTDPNTILDAASGPWYVSSNLTIPADKTLIIEPGTTLFFNRGKNLTVNGRIVVEGTEYERIRLALDPEAGGNPSQHWNGINFTNTLRDNRLRYVDMEFADNDSEAINISYSRVLIDNMTWLNTTNTILEVDHPSLIVRNSVFPNTTGVEIIHGTNLSGSEYFILKGNTFGTTTGYNDIIDFSGCARPGPIFEVYDNVFLGGEDDALDLDGTDAHIEGNLFMNFKGGVSSTSNAIATDLSSEIVAVRNIFLNNDRAVLLKGNAFIHAEHNVFTRSSVAAINFHEDGGVAGEGAYLDGDIFWDNNDLFENEFGADPNIIVNRCIISAEMHYLGVDNLDADPLFVDEDSNNFRLKAISPAIGAGINGLDMGAYVPSGASVSGEPNGQTYHTDATLTVDGPGITHYKYRINEGPWSSELSVDTPIVLTSLTDGNSYTVYTSGKNSASVWQSDPNFNASSTWTIDTSYSQLVINEILAQNIEAVDHNGTTPDIIELYYDGPAPLDLSDMSISDNPDKPRKFVFTGGPTMNPGDYLVLYADDNIWTPGIHLGFALDADGEGAYLYDIIANGGSLIDSVEFGLQLGDLSIGRVADGRWRLTLPTFGQANIAQILGNPATLKINEWLADEDFFRTTDFIEIYNPHPMPVDIGGMFLTDDPVARPNRHQITPLSFVPAAGYAVFIADGDPEDGLNHLNFRLSSDQEIIGLFDTELKEVDQVIYYPQTTDISEGRSPDGNNTYEFLKPPTTAVSNITTIVVNEVLAHSHGAAPDWIELYNTTDANIDISGWFLSDNSANRTKYRIADGTIIDVNDYIVFYEDTDFNDPCDSGCLTPFALSENGETVCISSAQDGVLTGYYKKQAFGASQTGISFGRYLKSTGIYDFVAMDSNTPGSTNVYPKVGPIVINEIMYHPDPNSDAEYIELYNITSADVNLYDAEGNPWMFTDGVDFTFPPDVNIPAHGYLLVVKDMNALESEYTSLPGDEQIFVWDSGSLDNAGETVEISMPGDVDAIGERQYICIDRVHYDDNAPWPTTPDGYGKSLTRKDPNDYGNDVINWDANDPSPGS
ncbi:MAG: lamin tail domain-containing protein [Planctomycetota bacterium]